MRVKKKREKWERGVKYGGWVNREGRKVKWIKKGREGTYKRTPCKMPMRLKSSPLRTIAFGLRIHRAFGLRA